MVELISNFTMAILGMLLTVGFKDLGWGVTFAMGIIVVWAQIWGLGMVPAVNFLGIWWWSIVAYSLVGYVFVDRAHTITFLDPRPGKSVSGKGDMRPWIVFAKYLLFLLLVGAVHIIFELNLTGFPKPGGGFVLAAALVIPYVVLWFIFLPDVEYFGSFTGYKSLSGGELKKTVRAHMRTFVFWLAMIHFVTTIVYTLVDWLVSETDVIFNYWYLWTIVILAVVSILTVVIAFARYTE